MTPSFLKQDWNEETMSKMFVTSTPRPIGQEGVFVLGKERMGDSISAVTVASSFSALEIAGITFGGICLAAVFVGVACGTAVLINSGRRRRRIKRRDIEGTATKKSIVSNSIASVLEPTTHTIEDEIPTKSNSGAPKLDEAMEKSAMTSATSIKSQSASSNLIKSQSASSNLFKSQAASSNAGSKLDVARNSLKCVDEKTDLKEDCDVIIEYVQRQQPDGGEPNVRDQGANAEFNIDTYLSAFKKLYTRYTARGYFKSVHFVFSFVGRTALTGLSQKYTIEGQVLKVCVVSKIDPSLNETFDTQVDGSRASAETVFGRIMDVFNQMQKSIDSTRPATSDSPRTLASDSPRPPAL